MAKITTKELFDKYYADKSESIIKKQRPQVDRSEVYVYEKKIGKQLVDMDVDELFEMILTFNANRNMNKVNYSIGYSSFNQIASVFRSVFNFYIDNYEVIKNPFYDSRMRGTEATKRLAQNKEAFTKEKLEEIIKRVHNDRKNTDRAEYIECILRLFYDGFSSVHEILALKKSMINFEEKTVEFPERTIQLSDRTFELLNKIHNSEYMTGDHGDYCMVSYHDSYFKYTVRPKRVSDFQDRDAVKVANLLNQEIYERVKIEYGIEISSRLVYLLGFVDFIKETYGEERCNELILAVRDSEAAKDLMNVARLYGVKCDNITLLKKSLRPYIEV